MNAEACSCRKPKAPLKCELCDGPICKNCVQTLEDDSFSFLKTIPPELSHRSYCRFCYDDKVAAPLENYAEVMERAKKVFVFFKAQKKMIPIIKRSKEVFKIKECMDRDEMIMRMAFWAAEQSYNAIIETEAIAEQVRNAGYQKSKWSGSASPAQIDEEKLEIQYQRDRMYR